MESSSSSSPSAAPAPGRSLEYVGFWKRFVAFLIDSFILLVITVPLLIAVYGTDYAARAEGTPTRTEEALEVHAFQPTTEGRLQKEQGRSARSPP